MRDAWWGCEGSRDAPGDGELLLPRGDDGEHDLGLAEVVAGGALDVGDGHLLVPRRVLLRVVGSAGDEVVVGELARLALHAREAVEEAREEAVAHAIELTLGDARRGDLPDLLA